MNEMIFIGKTVSTHGIKGELKVISEFERKDLAFQVGKTVLINNIEHRISSIRYHKNYILMGIDDLDNINNVLEYVDFNIYMSRLELGLKEDEFLQVDLVGATVIDNGKILGMVRYIQSGVAYNYLSIHGKKDFLIPIIPEYILEFNKEKKEIKTKNAKDLIM